MEVIKVDIHPYTLTPKVALNRLSEGRPREGALLRVWFKGLEHPGHADLFPWVELGDLPLRLQLETLREGTPLQLAAASVLWAYEEAKAVKQKQAFFPGKSIISHVTAVDREQLTVDMPLVKLKIAASDVENWEEIEKLFPRFPQTRWRLDFNGLFKDLAVAKQFWQKVSSAARERIDFLEDPVTESLMAHKNLREVFQGARMALDRSLAPEAWKNADVRVLKPITYSPEMLIQEADAFPGEVVVTSMMDHPLGQLIALRGAQLIQKKIGDRCGVAGLLTHDLYQPHAASDWVKTIDRSLVPTYQGIGWGLTEQLNALTWESLL